MPRGDVRQSLLDEESGQLWRIGRDDVCALLGGDL
jgi:hypothetical protein